MIKPGHIRIMIDQKVYFEYYKLEKPNPTDFWSNNWRAENPAALWKQELEEYEASKQLIEVSNGYLLIRDLDMFHLWFTGNKTGVSTKYNQPCKAEVTDNKATIIELN